MLTEKYGQYSHPPDSAAHLPEFLCPSFDHHISESEALRVGTTDPASLPDFHCQAYTRLLISLMDTEDEENKHSRPFDILPSFQPRSLLVPPNDSFPSLTRHPR